MEENFKDILFRGDTEDFIASLDDAAKRQIGHALWFAQTGRKASSAKPMKGFKGAAVLEIVTDFNTDTYRTVYTVEFDEAVYVVDAFQKKAKKGIATPQKDLDRIEDRIKQLAKDRKTPEGKAQIEQLKARKAARQRIIDEKRKKQNEPK